MLLAFEPAECKRGLWLEDRVRFYVDLLRFQRSLTSAFLAFHRIEELVVGFGLLQSTNQKFHCFNFVHWVQELP